MTSLLHGPTRTAGTAAPGRLGGHRIAWPARFFGVAAAPAALALLLAAAPLRAEPAPCNDCESITCPDEQRLRRYGLSLLTLDTADDPGRPWRAARALALVGMGSAPTRQAIWRRIGVLDAALRLERPDPYAPFRTPVPPEPADAVATVEFASFCQGDRIAARQSSLNGPLCIRRRAH